jgi:hypothetical protein
MLSVDLFGRKGNKTLFDSDMGNEFSKKYFVNGSSFAKSHRKTVQAMRALKKKQKRLLTGKIIQLLISQNVYT